MMASVQLVTRKLVCDTDHIRRWGAFEGRAMSEMNKWSEQFALDSGEGRGVSCGKKGQCPGPLSHCF